ncbi:MAG: nitroreductase family deazaflavin-dependent oxidoreductase [Acidobacteria bacterium]|nr:nitroreductase family deazaflavin-dependent oxidoreductase [Acidobacteriota bacterium]
MPSDLLMKSMNRFHRTLLTLSRGRLGWTAGGMPVLELTTIGRRSGEKRTSMLTSPAQTGEDIVVVASRGGDPVHPAWFLNLRENPTVEVVWKGGPRHVRTARVAEGEERAQLWQRIITDFPHYGGYQSKTTREIPLVVLTAAPEV